MQQCMELMHNRRLFVAAAAGTVACMSRRNFLRVLGATALTAACGPSIRSVASRAGAQTQTSRRAVRAVTFDLFTIFDPRAVEQRVNALLGNTEGFAATWKSRLFEYSWLRAASGQYVDFERLVQDSLRYAATTHGVALEPQTQAQLARTFVELTPWPDSLAALHELKGRGLVLAPLANFTPHMIEALLSQAQLRELFDTLISTDFARTYKPDPRAYALAESRLGLQRHEIAFAAFGGWDAAGARWYGYPTYWVNRLNVPAEELRPADATGPDLTSLARWLQEVT